MTRTGVGVVAILPARYSSTRLPGKPLLRETGRCLIQHVYEQVRKCPRLDRVIVATDDERIVEAVRAFGGEAAMTSPHHPSGTDRAAEVARALDCERVLNVQGDEPEVDPEHLGMLIDLLAGAEMVTLAAPFERPEEALLPQRVKVVIDRHHNALYFSRSRIPHAGPGSPPPLLHVGIYGYSRDFLLRYVTLDRTPLEQAEKLEQLRALEHGYKIKVGLVRKASPGGIDTPEDYAAFVRRYREGGSR